MKFLMVIGKQKKYENGLFITNEDGIVFEVERFWGKLFGMKGNASLNIRRLMVE